MLLLAIAIRLDSPGPAVFRQNRIGRDNVPFSMLKFRSMHVGGNGNHHRQEVAAWYEGRPAPSGNGYKAECNPAITRVGRLLRKTSLDELPQLVNVLKGDMSLVGPRPVVDFELEYFQPSYFERHLVKPGMTGPWQVNGRSSRSGAEMVELDIRYVRSLSLPQDVAILARTPLAVIDHFLKSRR